MKPTWRCSSLDRNLLCNGAPTLEARVSPRQGQEGDEGVFLHWMAHAKLKEKAAAVGDIGPTPTVPKSISFSAWIADYYVRFITETVPPTWSLECEVALSYEFDRFILSGHIDNCAMSPDGKEAIIFDLKTGRDPVDPADNNEQVFGYGCLLLRAYPELTKITAYIVQPLNDEDEGYQRISEPMVLEGEILARSLTVLESRINVALDNAMEVNSGPKQCKWCPAAMQCPATIAEIESMKIKLNKQTLAAITATPNDAVLASWVIADKILTRPMNDANELAKARIAAQGSIQSEDGIVITAKTTAGSYKYPDPVAFFAALRRRLPSDEQIAEALGYSMSKARDAIAKAVNVPKTGKAAVTGDSIVAAELKPLAIQGERTTLVISQ